MFLAVDIGNSRIKCGLFDGLDLGETFEMESNPQASVAAYRHSLRARLEGFTPLSAGISSVVPGLTDVVAQAVRDDFMIVPTIIDASLDLPFAIDYDPPESLGADRLCAAAAVLRTYRSGDPDTVPPIIVVDAGTAVTYDVIDGGCYRGGVIAPGPTTAASALARGTAKLPEIRLSKPGSPLAHNTAEGIRSGVIFGFLDSVSAMIGRLSAEIERTPFVVATGGWGAFLAENLEVISDYEPNLVLEGIRSIVNNAQL